MVHVFKTSVTRPADVKKLGKALNRIGAGAWNFDLQDCDRVLRVVSSEATTALKISAVLRHAGYACEELSDD